VVSTEENHCHLWIAGVVGQRGTRQLPNKNTEGPDVFKNFDAFETLMVMTMKVTVCYYKTRPRSSSLANHFNFFTPHHFTFFTCQSL
jgi:hypothetical protein